MSVNVMDTFLFLPINGEKPDLRFVVLLFCCLVWFGFYFVCNFLLRKILVWPEKILSAMELTNLLSV